MTEWWRNIESKPVRYDLGPVFKIDHLVTTDELIERWPDHYQRHRIELYDRGMGWGIFDSEMCLGKSGEWVWSRPSTDEWIAQHRWQDPEEAIAFYKAWLVEFMEKEGRGDGDE